MSLQELLTPHLAKWTYNMTVSIGKGWEPLVEELHYKLVELDPRYKILQVKEKFGLLRVYIHVEPLLLDKAHQLVNEAEAKSESICEDCGAPGTTGNSKYGFWIRTLCEDCREVINKRYEERHKDQ